MAAVVYQQFAAGHIVALPLPVALRLVDAQAPPTPSVLLVPDEQAAVRACEGDIWVHFTVKWSNFPSSVFLKHTHPSTLPFGRQPAVEWRRQGLRLVALHRGLPRNLVDSDLAYLSLCVRAGVMPPRTGDRPSTNLSDLYILSFLLPVEGRPPDCG